jgi:hypothetical protein
MMKIRKMMNENVYYILACWRAREETADELAARLLQLIERLQRIDPVFALWTSGNNRPMKFESIRDRYAEIVTKSMSKDDLGESMPIDGYWFGAITRGHPATRSYAVNVHAGAHMPKREHQNSLQFGTWSMTMPDPASITYPIFRSALLAIVDTWNPDECLASCDELHGLIDLDNHFREAWMQYLSPTFADLIAPPENLLVERLPNGGLLMSATTETFRADDPAHLAAARAIGAATLALNKLPYVRDPKFR